MLVNDAKSHHLKEERIDTSGRVDFGLSRDYRVSKSLYVIVTSSTIDRLEKDSPDGSHIVGGAGLRILLLSSRCDLTWIYMMIATHFPPALYPAFSNHPWL